MGRVATHFHAPAVPDSTPSMPPIILSPSNRGGGMEGEEGGWKLPAVVADAVSAVPEGWRPRAVKFFAHLIGSKMPSVAAQVADHIDRTSGRSLILNELAKAAAAKAVQSPELVDRTLTRLCGDLLDRQQNVEQIALLAAEEIVSDGAPPSEEDVKTDWRRKFASYAEDVSDPDMQRVWSKILAGEFKSPGSFSFRTLRIVSEMGGEVAQIFADISQHRFADNAIFVPGREWNVGKDLNDLQALEDWGLINERAGQLNRPIPIKANRYSIWGARYAALIYAENGKPEINIPIVTYTSSGRELLKLLPPHDEFAVITRIAEHLRNEGVYSKVAFLGARKNDGDTMKLMPPYHFLWGDAAALVEAHQQTSE